MNPSVWIAGLLLGSGLVGAPVARAEELKHGRDSAAFAVETFSPPKLMETKTPTYPRSRQRRGQEGWVQLNLMVDPTGKPYNITVVDSSNDSAFERQAIRSAEQWVYQPALLNGEPIDAGSGGFITFGLKRSKPGASSGFIRRYKNFSKQIENKDKEAATLVFEELKALNRNLYEEAYYHLARFEYHQFMNADPAIVYEAIRTAAIMDESRGFLPKRLLTRVLLAKLALELEQSRLASAKSTAKTLQERDLTDESLKFVEAAINKIEQVEQSKRPFALRDALRGDNRNAHELLHSQFQLTNIDGDVAELRLNCDRGFVGFIYEPDTVYSVRSDLNDCTLILIGTPQTQYTLVQGKL